ncbi:MAG: DUF4340 domain-containing protein [Verrucomicrobia bacterium]|nr:DUF4340 domain-containing protein [Verrucomicrobiota bacterium]MBU1736075.1 DUF4340 domain-containing protein [Verrucomicrobiota bacterium]MBU1857635.1 DUF4340 domain-containing protein [Verrucomicrobiota bacterium]
MRTAKLLKDYFNNAMHVRTTFFLLILSVLLGAFISIVEWGGKDEGEQDRPNLRLLDIEPENVIYWSFSRDTLFVACANEQGQWIIHKPVEARADSIKLNHMLAVMAKLPRGEIVTAAQRTSRSLSLDDYGLGKPLARMVLGDAEHRHTLAVGGLSPMKDTVYVQVDNADDVIATSTNLLDIIPRAAADLRDPRLLAGAPAYVKGLAIKRLGGPLVEIIREGTEWIIHKPITARADWFKVSSLLEQLFNLQIQQFVAERMADPAIYGLSDDEMILQFNIWKDEEKNGLKLCFGKRANEKGDLIYTAYRGTGSVFAVQKDQVDALKVGVSDLRDSRLYFMAADAIAWIRVEEGEKVLQLQKTASGFWQVTEPAQWKADARIVEDLISRLNSLRIEGFLSSTNLPDLGLDPPARVIRMADAVPVLDTATQSVAGVTAPATQVTGILPTGRTLAMSRPLPGKEYIYAKFEDEDQLYQLSVAAAVTLALDPIAYRDSVVLALDPTAVTKIMLRKKGVEQAVTREGAGPWVPVAPSVGPVNLAVITTLLEKMATLRAVRFERSERNDLGIYGLKDPRGSLTFILSGQEGIQKTLVLGEASEDLGVYSMVQGQEVVFILPKALADQLLQDVTR